MLTVPPFSSYPYEFHVSPSVMSSKPQIFISCSCVRTAFNFPFRPATPEEKLGQDKYVLMERQSFNNKKKFVLGEVYNLQPAVTTHKLLARSTISSFQFMSRSRTDHSAQASPPMYADITRVLLVLTNLPLTFLCNKSQNFHPAVQNHSDQRF